MSNAPKTLSLFKSALKEQPFKTALILLILLLSTFVEAIGITLIFPVITIFLDFNTAIPDNNFGRITGVLSKLNIYLLCVLILICFLTRAAILQATAFIVSKYIAQHSHGLRVDSIEAMANADYPFIQKQRLGKSLNVLVSNSSAAGYTHVEMLQMVSSIMQVILYLTYAAYISTLAFLITVVSAGFILFLARIIVRYTKIIGHKNLHLTNELSNQLSDLIRSIKEIKATGREKTMTKLIAKKSEQLKTLQAQKFFVDQTPKNIHDPVVMLAIISCLLVFTELFDFSPSEIIFILAVYYRLMTSINLLQSEYQRLVSQQANYFSVLSFIQNARKSEEKNLGKNPYKYKKPQPISLKNIDMKYHDKNIFKNQNFDFPAQKLTLIRGTSGRGKTTLIDIICGLVRPQGGSITIGGKDLKDFDIKEWRQQLSYVDQFPFILNGSIKDNIIMDFNQATTEDIEDVIKKCNLASLISSLEHGFNQMLEEDGSNISGGQRQRVAIARSLIRKPHYIFLDEPTSALDEKNSIVIFKLLKELSSDITVILVSHDSTAIPYADHVIDLDPDDA